MTQTASLDVCSHCGKPGRSYVTGHGYHRRICTTCFSSTVNSRLRAAQNRTLLTATKHKEPWTSADMDLVLAHTGFRDLPTGRRIPVWTFPAEEVARATGRTLRSIYNLRRKHRYGVEE